MAECVHASHRDIGILVPFAKPKTASTWRTQALQLGLNCSTLLGPPKIFTVGSSQINPLGMKAKSDRVGLRLRSGALHDRSLARRSSSDVQKQEVRSRPEFHMSHSIAFQ